jgi:hypothetical protein
MKRQKSPLVASTEYNEATKKYPACPHCEAPTEKDCVCPKVEDLPDRMLAFIPHKRKRAGIANPNKVGYVRFTYACVPDCPRCRFTSEISARIRQRAKKQWE